MEKYSRAFLEQTKTVWQPYAISPLSDHDAVEITENMVNLFEFLKVLDEKYKK